MKSRGIIPRQKKVKKITKSIDKVVGMKKKRGVNSYLCFMVAKRGELLQQKLSFAEINSNISKLWSELSETEKEVRS